MNSMIKWPRPIVGSARQEKQFLRGTSVDTLLEGSHIASEKVRAPRAVAGNGWQRMVVDQQERTGSNFLGKILIL